MLLNGFPSLSVGPKYMIVHWEMSHYNSICLGVISNTIYCLSMLSKHIVNDISHSGVCLCDFPLLGGRDQCIGK